jgi:hypothetical protein
MKDESVNARPHRICITFDGYIEASENDITMPVPETSPRSVKPNLR